MRLLTALFLLSSSLLGLSQPAVAQKSAVVLGLRSVEGDDELALSLSQELRKVAGSVDDWSVGSQAVSLSQMVLVHGCDETDAACLSTIATGLKVDLLVYGTVSHSSLDDDFRFEVELGLFDRGAMEVAKRTSIAFDQSQANAVGLEKVARRLITGIAPQSATAAIRIESNVEGAQAFVDGRGVGTVDGGVLVVENLTVGSHQVRLQAIGYEGFSQVVDTQAGETTTVDASLAADAVATSVPVNQWDLRVGSSDSVDRGVPNWLPYGLLGFGIANAGGLIASWFVIKSVGDDANYIRYSSIVADQDPDASDLCAEAAKGNTYNGSVSSSEAADVSGLCDRASTFETLQFVFGGVAAASIVGSIVLWAVDEDDADETALRVEPILGTRVNGLRATVSF